MATTHPLPVSASESPHGADASAGAEQPRAAQALVPALRPPEEEAEIGVGTQVERLPVELDVAVPVRDFRVRDLLALAPGQLIESQWGNGEDVPLAAGDTQLAWSEFEVAETRLLVRVTQLA